MLCVAIAEADIDAVITALTPYEYAEIRLDAGTFSVADVGHMFSKPGKKLIATYRPGDVSDAERIELLRAAIDAGAAYVDVEVENSDSFKDAIIPYAHEHDAQVIVSYHNFSDTPEHGELNEIMRWCRSSGADIIKVVSTVHTPKDAARILALYESETPVIALGMGAFGRITRVASVLLGAPFTYVSSQDGRGTAPGQIDVSRMREILSLIQQD